MSFKIPTNITKDNVAQMDGEECIACGRIPLDRNCRVDCDESAGNEPESLVTYCLDCWNTDFYQQNSIVFGTKKPITATPLPAFDGKKLPEEEVCTVREIAKYFDMPVSATHSALCFFIPRKEKRRAWKLTKHQLDKIQRIRERFAKIYEADC